MAPTRVILMSCGSYNPPTNMHLRMFEIARDHLHRMGTHVVVGGLISPVHDTYMCKKDLASATHRCSMLRLALHNSDWIRLSTWETRQNCWTKTRICLQHHQNLLNSVLSNFNDIIHLPLEDTEWIPENIKNSSDKTPIQIKLLCGADLLESFGIPGLWLEEDIDAIVGEHGLVVITREGSNPNKFIYDSDILAKHMNNICIVTEWIPNEVSSTRIRRALKRNESVRYLLQDSVIDYIYKHEIYDARTPDTTIKLELSSLNANNYLHIDPRYLTAFLTPSPSDVTMDSPSPIEIVTSIDMPDAVVLCKNFQNAGSDGGGNRLDEAREQFIGTTFGSNVDNGNVKHVARAAYPGQAKQIIANKTGITRIIEVGPLDKPTTKFRSDSSSQEDCRSILESIARDRIKIEQREVSDLKSKTEIINVDLDSNDREIIVKILPDLSSSSKLAFNEEQKFVVENNIKEMSDLKSKIGIDLSLNEIMVKSDQSSDEMVPIEICKSVKESIIKGKIEIEQREVLQLRFKTDANVDSNNEEEIVRVQPGPSNTSEMILKKAKLTMKSAATDKTEGQKEILDLRCNMKSTDINLSLGDNGDVMEIQSNRSNSNELRLGECCWPTRENTTNDKIEICDKKIISTKEIFDMDLHLDDRSTIASKRIIDDKSMNQFNVNQIELERDSTLVIKGKDNLNSNDINVKKEIIDVNLSFVETDNVVKVQPAHSIHNIVIPKEDDYRWTVEKLTNTKVTPEEKKNRYRENLELSNVDKNDTESVKSDSERIMKNNMEDTETHFKKEIADFELDKVNHSKIRATSLNVSMASLDGRHECALSDFSIEDYRLSQYGSDEEKEKGKFLHTAESSLTKHIDDQCKDVTGNIVDSMDDNKISAKKNNIQSCNNQVLVCAMVHKSYEEEPGNLTTEKMDNCTKSIEEMSQSRFIEKRLFSEIGTNDKIDVENRNQMEVFKETNRIEKVSEFDSVERRIIPCDPNLEIDGKYLKSIVNSRKSPRKIREDQVHDIEIKEQLPVTDNRQVLFPSEEFQSSAKAKSIEMVKKDQIYDANTDIEKKDRIIDNQKTSHVKEVSQDSSRMISIKLKNVKKIDEHYIGENKQEFKNQDKFISDREVSRVENVFQSPPRSVSMKSPKKTENSESEREFLDQDKSFSDQEISQASQKSSRISTSIKSPNKMRKSQIIYRSNEMKDYDRSINDRVISQLEEVFQDLSKKSSTKSEASKTDYNSYIETKKQSQSTDNREVSRSEEPSQRSSKTFSVKSPKKAEQKSAKMDDKKEQQAQEKAKETKIANGKTKQDFKEIKDVYTRKVRRYNVPLQGSLDSMIVSDESKTMQNPKKDDTFSKKSKSYESIKRIQEVFLGVPPSKANSSGSQLDIPDEFCSICCYMNEITFRTEEEVSSPNQETFYTLRSTCSSLADDDSIECDICDSLNLQEPTDDLDNKLQEIPCELCRICGEVDSSYEQNSAMSSDRYTYKVVELQRDDDDNFEIENCGFQSGPESADDRSKVSEKGKIKDPERPKSQSLFIHGSSMMRDQPRELYFIPKDEVAILTSGVRRIGRKGSLFRKKEDIDGNVRDNRRYSSVDSLQLAKISSKTNDTVLKIAKDPTLIGSADNLISRNSRRSKSLQRSTDVSCLNSSTDNLMENLGKENEAENSARKSNIRDKEAVKMILTQHGIKIISEKETAL